MTFAPRIMPKMSQELDILLVEDDADTRLSLCDVLELDGHRVAAAADASTACELAAERPFNVVILDRQLPDGTAEQLMPQLRERLPESHVVVVTGYADMSATIAAFRHGASDYILKPINPDALRNSLARIQQLQQVELELKQEQEFANKILQTAEAVVLVLDLDGRINHFNPYFERISGYTLQQLQGKDWFQVCIPKRDHAEIREVFLLTAEGIETSGMINPIVTSKGKERQIRWSNTTLKDDCGNVTAVLAVGVDVTDFIEAQERASRSERLAAIGQTMTALAHESRNALQRIHAGLDLLQLNLGDDPEDHKDLNNVQRAANDLNSLLEEVRSYAAPIRLLLESCDLRAVYQRAWRNLESSWGKREVQFVEQGTEQLISCHIDAVRMERVFRNLFENALAACADPVQISLQVNSVDDGEICVTVSDNGPGLNHEQSQKIFEPFYTTKSSGTGLGMSIVRRIIEAHQGCIFVVENDGSESPCGAQFMIRLPVKPKYESPDQ